MDLGAFAYLKTLDGFHKHKPIIALSSSVLQEYLDYFIVDGYLFVIGVHDVYNVDAMAVYTLSMVCTDNVKILSTDEVLGADVTKITPMPAGDWGKAMKDIIQRTASGECNHGIPYTSLKICVEDYVNNVNETAKIAGKFFTVDNMAMDATKFAEVGPQGEVYSKRRFVGEYDKIELVTVPLNGVYKTPLKDYINDEIREYIDQYLKNLHIEHGRAWKTGTSYHKGENIFVDINTEKDGKVIKTERKYFVSKVEGNTTLPTSDYWLEIDDPAKKE